MEIVTHSQSGRNKPTAKQYVIRLFHRRACGLSIFTRCLSRAIASLHVALYFGSGVRGKRLTKLLPPVLLNPAQRTVLGIVGIHVVCCVCTAVPRHDPACSTQVFRLFITTDAVSRGMSIASLMSFNVIISDLAGFYKSAVTICVRFYSHHPSRQCNLPACLSQELCE